MADDQDRARPEQQVVWVDTLLQRLPLSRFAIAMLMLCIVAGMTEGYDTVVMALAAPMISSAWSLAPHQTGLLLSGSVFGVVIGSFALSPLGDRWGRRPSILLGLTCAGIATLCGGLAPNLWSLLTTRFVAGLGLALAFPNVIALAMELVPARFRTLAVVLVNCGYPFGSGVGGIIAAHLVPWYGFKAIFLVGGISTLAIAGLSFLVLPESPLFLARKPAAHDRLRALLDRLGAVTPGPPAAYAVHGETGARSPVSALFERERRLATFLLWILTFANMAIVYYLFTWLPSIIASKGATAQLTILSISAFSMGSVGGGIVMALLLARLGPTIVLSCAYAMTIATAIGLCTFQTVDDLFLATLALCGAVTGGSQFCLNAVVNQFYSSAMRATASGYATGVGRLGAVIAPAAGVVIMSNPTLAAIAFSAPAVPALVALTTLLLLQLKTRYSQAIEVVG